MKVIAKQRKEQILELIKELNANPINKKALSTQLINQIDFVTRTRKGIEYIYEIIPELMKADIFEGTAWNNPKDLIPTLVKGTLCTGLPTNILELVSELRMLKIAKEEYHSSKISQEDAQTFLEEAIVSSFDIAFGDTTEAERINLSVGELKRIKNLFRFILAHVSISNLKKRLVEEVEAIANQRPIITYRLETILKLIRDKAVLKKFAKEDRILTQYVSALFYPTPKSKSIKDPEEYIRIIAKGTGRTLRKEGKLMGEKMEATGLVSEYHMVMLNYLVDTHQDLIPVILHLNNHGRAEFEQHQDFITKLIKEFLLETNKQAIFGLKKLLERNLLSRKPVFHALQRLTNIKLHHKVVENLKKSTHDHLDTQPIKLLVGGTVSVLGQPLGIGQGNNPTCQSARGISMWSLHAPAKLLNLIADAAVSNKLKFRYEGQLIQSLGLEHRNEPFDFNLDPISVLLVPHLDDVYGKMMQRAMLKHIGKDPHVSVNPAFYGHWIQTSFVSCYSSLSNSIIQFDRFVRLFYASFHPEYNGGHHLVYPVPIGIFITDAKARMLGFHAISLLRVGRSPNGELRAYFYNPNNEGRQNWGQEIKPTVSQNGEVPGESSLPFYQFVSRVYAFHYNSNGIKDRIIDIPAKEVRRVESLAVESWGRKYIWS